MNIKESFGNKVRELRNSLGISQEKFALKIDMDRTYFASVESGKRNISIENIFKISKGLEVSMAELFKDKIDVLIDIVQTIDKVNNRLEIFS